MFAKRLGVTHSPHGACMRKSLRSSRRALAALATAAVALGVAVACHDADSPDAVARPTAPLQSRADIASRTAELHRKNPMDWVGVLHNEILDEARRDMINTHKMPTDVCGRVHRFLSTSAHPKLRGAPAAVQQAVSDKLVTDCKEKFKEPKRDQVFRNAAYRSQESSFTQTFWDAVARIQVQADAAYDPGDLASRLAPILETTYSMNELDAAGVQAVISVTLSSVEYWWDGTALSSYDQQYNYDYNRCLGGTAYGIVFDAGAVYHTCVVGGDPSVQQPLRGAPPRGSAGAHAMVRLAAYEPGAVVAPQIVTCGQSGFSRLRSVWNADVAGASHGAVVGMIAGAVAGGLSGAIWGAGMGTVLGAGSFSAASAGYNAASYLICATGGAGTRPAYK
jgi:hypothetical protein